MATAGPSLSLQLQQQQKQAVSGLPAKLKIIALLLFAIAGLMFVLGVVTLLQGSAAGLLDILIALVVKVSALVMLTAASSAAYASQVPEYDKIHTFNLIADLAMFYKVLFNLGLFLVLILGIKVLVALF